MPCPLVGSDEIPVLFADNNIDPRDHPFILGATAPGTRPLNEVLAEAREQGAGAAQLCALSERWAAEARLMRFPEAVEEAIMAQQQHEEALRAWRAQAYRLSLPKARALARQLLQRDVHFDWDAPRSREGYFRVKGGVDYCVARAVAYAPHADLLWMEVGRVEIEGWSPLARCA